MLMLDFISGSRGFVGLPLLPMRAVHGKWWSGLVHMPTLYSQVYASHSLSQSISWFYLFIYFSPVVCFLKRNWWWWTDNDNASADHEICRPSLSNGRGNGAYCSETCKKVNNCWFPFYLVFFLLAVSYLSYLPTVLKTLFVGCFRCLLSYQTW